MAHGFEELAVLPDPVGETIAAWRRPSGLEIARGRVRIGVVLSIYESRPNVPADSAALCLKTANAVLLKGGSEAQATNRAIAGAVRAEVEAAGLPAAAVQLVEGGREVARGLLKRDDRIDVVIARGGETLKHTILEESRIPVVKHFEGICHLYVDESADLAMAERICLNAKVERPSVCNAIENLLVHQAVAPEFLPRIAAALGARGGEGACATPPPISTGGGGAARSGGGRHRHLRWGVQPGPWGPPARRGGGARGGGAGRDRARARGAPAAQARPGGGGAPPAHARAGGGRRVRLPRLARRARPARPVVLDRHAARAAGRGGGGDSSRLRARARCISRLPYLEGARGDLRAVRRGGRDAPARPGPPHHG